MKAALAVAGLLLLAGCGAPKNDIASPGSPSASAENNAPKFGEIIVTNDESTKPSMTTFAPDTAKIFVLAPFENVKTGSKIKATWIAEKVEGAAPNFKINEVTFDVTPLVNELTASMTSPTKGWPVGTYHVDLTLDGKPMGTAKFSVAK